ncbi:hypothetical protein MFM001_09960 [Mycobacterium sp. MFM001]|nr:hypothetical protein MFM001_09960 [Mycobacterium sp. MFM001]
MRKLLFAALLVAGGVGVAPTPVALANYPCGTGDQPTTSTQACLSCIMNLHGQSVIPTCLGPAAGPAVVDPNDPRCAMFQSATRHAQCIDSLMSGQPMPPLN